MKVYKSAPLPFQGQKRLWWREYKSALDGFDDECIFIDLFGGSGLLSDYTKRHSPNARVIYNDFDNYSDRIRNIAKTNDLIDDLRCLADREIPNKRISDYCRHKLICRLEYEKGYVDWHTVSSNILHTMTYVNDIEAIKNIKHYYNNIVKTNYSADGYLDGVEVMSADYMELFDNFKLYKNAVFIIDPPYLSTDNDSYNSFNWRLTNYLDIVKMLENTNFIYFTSGKSSIIELLDWMNVNSSFINPFSGANFVEKKAISVSRDRNEIMIVKKLDNDR